jgi:capsid protein
VAFLDLFRGKQTPRPAVVPVVRARFDAAEKGDDYRHWANADSFSADAALSPSVRRTLRNRARYERANNSYLAGISSTLANDLIGTGPRLQLDTGDAEADRLVERLFFDWGWTIDLPAKLRTMREALVVDGEAFALMITESPARRRHAGRSACRGRDGGDADRAHVVDDHARGQHGRRR